MHYSFKSTPTTTLKSRTQTITKSNQLSSIPGPFDYNVNKPLPKAATIAQTKQKRQLWKRRSDSPGPGAYESPSYITQGPKRSMSAHIIRPQSKVPGPASYDTNNLKIKLKAPVFSMGNKSKSPLKIIQDQNLYKPAPTQYQTLSPFLKGSKIVIGNSNRKDLTQTQKTPAPGYYQAEKTQLVSIHNPRCTVGTQKRELKIISAQDTPGPAIYGKKSFIEQNKSFGKGFSCRQKLRDLIAQQMARVPAPGQYQADSLVCKSKAPRCATTGSKRKTFIDDVQTAKKDIPAFTQSQTGFFNSSRNRASSACIIGRSTRRPLDQNESTPGPVAYNSDGFQILRRNPSFSCPKTIPKNEFLKVVDPQNPGPGEYNPNKSVIQPKVVSAIQLMEKRPSFDKEAQKPGVGQYNLARDNKLKFSWSKQKRIPFTDLKSQAKNGSHYNLNTNFTNPPSYMHVTSKVQYSPMKSLLLSTGF